MSRVLLCARQRAAEVPAIVDALRHRGAEAIVVDPSVFPTGVPMTLAYDRAGFHGHWSHARDELRDITAVWQNLVVGAELPAMEPGSRETCIAASERAAVGFLDSLEVFQLDPYWNKARADNKPYQLRLAQRLGLDIPETIVSNDPDAVRAFARRCGSVITKMLVQPTSGGPASDGDAEVVFTTAMTAADLAQLDGLDLCPMIFQEHIENQRDVRVTIVGKRLFSAAIDARARGGDDIDERSEKSPVGVESDPTGSAGGSPQGGEKAPREIDWRRQSYQLDRAPVWTPYELPGPLADRVLQLMDHLGLNYGAVDLIVRPDGRHVFLELNASGSFAFLGASYVAPVATAIADVLTYPGARRP